MAIDILGVVRQLISYSAILIPLATSGKSGLIERLNQLAETAEAFKKAFAANDESAMIRSQKEFETQTRMFLKRALTGHSDEELEELMKLALSSITRREANVIETMFNNELISPEDRRIVERQLDEVIGLLRGFVMGIVTGASGAWVKLGNALTEGWIERARKPEIGG